LLGLCLLLALPAYASAIRVVDDNGQKLVLPRPPQRIISLTPHLTELLYAVGAGNQVVGADSASDFPAAARRLPRVGDYSRIHFERILALKPDLILAWTGGNRPADIHGLQQMGVPVLHTQATRLDDVARLLRLIGQATGHARQGDTAAQTYSARLAALRRKPTGSGVKVFYQIWDRPLMTVGGSHWISDALTLCGAQNVFADVRALSAVVSNEAVLKRAPELIISGTDAPRVSRQWQRFTGLPAVRQRAFVRVDADLLHRPTPRLIAGVTALCQAVSPYVR
jgi:iron complex transport system substrate-binding protein